jgi:3-oxoacyl-[acyl-carrier protein] reductase
VITQFNVRFGLGACVKLRHLRATLQDRSGRKPSSEESSETTVQDWTRVKNHKNKSSPCPQAAAGINKMLALFLMGVGDMTKYALITGASGGIGRAISLKLAKEGYSLYLHYYKNKESLKKLMEELTHFDGDFIPIQADLSSPTGYLDLVSNIFSIDVIVHNSGMSQYGLLVDLKQSEAEQLISTHVTSPLLLTKELLPKLLSKRSGNIIVISSIWGQTGAACEVAYSTVKGAQLSFVKALSKEVALNGIRVNGVAPGAIQTPMMTSFTEEDIDSISEEIPMGKLGKPENIADVVSFLLSEQAAYITGQIIPVNGGWYT